MKSRLFSVSLLLATALPTLAHDPSAHMRRPQPTPESCAPFAGKDPTVIDLKDPKVKAQYDKCEADKKLQREAAEAANPHDK